MNRLFRVSNRDRGFWVLAADEDEAKDILVAFGNIHRRENARSIQDHTEEQIEQDRQMGGGNLETLLRAKVKGRAIIRLGRPRYWHVSLPN